ncbi:MAG: flagellar hook protein FlgE [Burkholderiales bacterium]|jgi:flagellar hook protein FlgE|nr:flagellar hook protein FlgE [Burkholderiales bacterium]
MGFQQGLSGLNVSARNLDVIGNNVANAQTVGFKQSVAQFADVFAAALGGGGATQIGIGARVMDVAQTFNQGNVTPTNNPLDIAVTGQGFFRLSDNGSIVYSRNGQFRLDREGFLVNTLGQNVTGYGVDTLGNVVQGQPDNIRFDTADIPPRATTRFEAGLNLDSRNSPPAVAPFSPTNTRTYNFSTSGTTFDTLGNPHTLTLFFVKTATPNQWQMHGTVDGGPVGDADVGAGAGNPVTLNFDTAGTLTTGMPLAANLTVSSGAVSPVAFSLDLTSVTQFGAAASVNALSQDGFTSGRLSGYNVAGDGTIVGRYSNGQSRNLGQIVLTNFVNPQGLAPLGDNLWEQTADSGLPLTGTPDSGSLGQLQSGAVEDSNVDLTQELVNMIIAQRVYQANAQTIKTQDAILQTLVNIR